MIPEIKIDYLTIDPTNPNTKPARWIKLSDTKLLIIVGVTGVGKSTTVAAMAAGGLSYSLLPNRRELTDRFMISFLQQQQDELLALVQDRSSRFEYTRRYRQQFPGGMGHTLAQLSIDQNMLTAEWLIFDGLRGENEVAYAAEWLPNARFLMLDAPDYIRVQRLLKRNDAFDQIGSAGSESIHLADLGDVNSLFSETDLQKLLQLVDRGEVTLDELRGKLEIVKKERQNYDPAATKMALLRDAADRTIYVNSATMSAGEAAAFALDKLY